MVVLIRRACGKKPIFHHFYPRRFLRRSLHDSPLHAFVVQVFKGLNEATGELFAVKQIKLTGGSKEETLALESEIRVMKDLHHRWGSVPRYNGFSNSLQLGASVATEREEAAKIMLYILKSRNV